MNKIKSLVFVSNYFNHHQKFLSDEFEKILGDNYHFIETVPMEEERKKGGWKEYDEPYLLKTFISEEQKKKSLRLINDADLVIVGSADEYYLKQRIKQGKIIFRYSERPFKGKYKSIKFPIWFIKYNLRNPRKKPIFLLCASAFAYYDYQKMFLFKQKAYKWGYFTKVNEYNSIENLIAKKERNSVLWCGRMISWKHLEDAIYVIKKLSDDGYSVTMKVIGDGPLKNDMIKLTEELHLENIISFLGTLNSDSVRLYMERSQIFLFTSDFNEGWGAVLNESLNSGCAVICSHSVGSAPFLISNKDNGLIYKLHDIFEMKTCIEYLLDNPDQMFSIQKNAYYSMIEKWSPKIAAKRLIDLAEMITDDKTNFDSPFVEGPCSNADYIKNNWYGGENNYDLSKK